MSVVNGPNMGMKYGYEDKQDGWGDGYNYGQRVADWGLQPSIDARGPQSSPPTSPEIEPGSACIVSPSPFGDFADHANAIALRTELEGEGAWIFLTPKDGWEVFTILPPDGSSSVPRRLTLRYIQGEWAPTEQPAPPIKQAEGASPGSASAQGDSTIALGGDSRAVYPGDIVLGVSADSPLNGRDPDDPTAQPRDANIALGYQAVVRGKASVALGAGSRVYNDQEYLVSIGDVDPANAAEPVFLRRLTGLDYGSDPFDAVCLRQMQEAGGYSVLDVQSTAQIVRYPDAKLALVQALVGANQPWQVAPDQMRSGWVLKGFAYKVVTANAAVTGINVGVNTGDSPLGYDDTLTQDGTIPATSGAEGIYMLQTPYAARRNTSLVFCTQDQGVNFPSTVDSFAMYIVAIYERHEASWSIS